MAALPLPAGTGVLALSPFVRSATKVLFAICSSAYLIAFAIHHALAPSFEQLELSVSASGAPRASS